MLHTTIDDLRNREPEVDLGTTEWQTIEQARINEFAHATGDEQWIHVDVDRAAEGPYGATIAHGYLTLSLLSPLLKDLLVVADARSSIDVGLNRVRFPRPVLSGSQIRAQGVLTRILALSHGVQTVTQVNVVSSDGGKPALVAEVTTRFLP
jgi:acyl dehydratase